MAEFSPDELEELIREALAKGRPTESERIFRWGDSRLFELLADILPNFLEHEQRVEIYQMIRHRLFAEVTPTSELKNLHSATINLKNRGVIRLPLWNITDPSLVLVSEKPGGGMGGDDLVPKALKDAGFSSENCAWTSLVRGDDELTEAPFWGNFLFSELRLWNPGLIVPMGQAVTEFFLGKTKITEAHGMIRWEGIWAFMPTFSGAHAVKAGKETQLFKDMKIAYQFLHGEKHEH